MHRGDPWLVQKLLTKLQGFIGSVLSVLSAILLSWQWIRRKKVNVGDYQQQCTNLDLNAQRAAVEGEFGEAEGWGQRRTLAKLKTEVLEQHHAQFMSGDKAVVEVVSRIEKSASPAEPRPHQGPAQAHATHFGPPPRKAA